MGLRKEKEILTEKCHEYNIQIEFSVVFCSLLQKLILSISVQWRVKNEWNIINRKKRLLKHFISPKAWKWILPLSRTTFVYRSHGIFTPKQLIIIEIIILSTCRYDFIRKCLGWMNNLNSVEWGNRKNAYLMPIPQPRSVSSIDTRKPTICYFVLHIQN